MGSNDDDLFGMGDRDLETYQFETGEGDIVKMTAPATFRQHGTQTAEDSHLISPKVQICLSWNAVPVQIRHLNAMHVSKLVCITGIVINSSRTSSKATNAWVQCAYCHDEKRVPVKPGFSAIHIPKHCDGKGRDGKQCPPGSYVIVADKCSFIDQQTLKLQESPETVPTGEIPRNVILHCDRYLVERAPPGTRLNIVGIYSTFASGGSRGSGKSARGGKQHLSSASIRFPYVRVLGIQVNNQGSGRSEMTFSKSEEAKFIEFALSTQNVFELIAKNIDPAIWGHDDIKKAITCQLFGGASKTMSDGIRRRGDINILLLGDPSTAKSQLLKFTEKVAPIGVYTSGKGSSAAGLTACVIKEPGTGEYYLEGGSMVLADGGIVCIDEFDKMRDQDRVAIHEAMEQQTISIAKAGITTVLNSRTSVLAAANPVFGRYDDTRSAEEQIDFQTTILSRFDMIFIVRDHKNARMDERIARHVVSIHMGRNVSENQVEGTLDLNFLKRYIAYCRTKCSPRLSIEASDVLLNYYVNQRARSVNSSGNTSSASGMPVIPITVRQLEALVRISESLARMTLAPIATEDHAQEAIRLFTASTIHAIQSGAVPSDGGDTSLQEIEEAIKNIVPLKNTIHKDTLVTVLERKHRFKRNAIERAIHIMNQRGEIDFRNQRRAIVRVR